MNKILKIFLTVFISCALLLAGAQKQARADYSDYQKPMVTLSFDDGFASVYELALPILSKYGFRGTVFMVTSDINRPQMLTSAQLVSLQNQYGWEIGSHTRTHPELPLLNSRRLTREITGSYDTLTALGLNVTSFSTPYGAYDNSVLAEILKVYNLQRGFWERSDFNWYPYDRAIIVSQSVDRLTTMDTILGWIDRAKAENKWLLLVMHDIAPVEDMDDWEYYTSPEELETICAYIASQGIEVVTPNFTLNLNTDNLLANPSFERGFETWSTDAPAQFVVDSAGHGSFPSPTSSLMVSGSATEAHMFSERVEIAVNDYLVEVFVNSDNLASGEIGFYMDEFDSEGVWISGKWLGQALLDRVAYFGRVYTPTSQDVKSVSLQTYITASSSGYVYLDNYKLSSLGPTSTLLSTVTPTPTENPTPTQTPTSTPTPTATPTPVEADNLVENPGFEDTDSAGWALAWIRQTSDWVIDLLVNGNQGSNSAYLNAFSRTHLFSQRINIDPNQSYLWSQYVKAVEVGSEFGFYIDEYDDQGSWISGQWKGMINDPYEGVVEIDYTPTSSNVFSVGLQYYFVGGDQTVVYLDGVSLTAR